MKLVKQNRNGFNYQLNEEEAQSLRVLVHQFPIAPISSAKISKTDAQVGEREKLLNESLAAHRKELKHAGIDLIGEEKFKQSGDAWFFRVSLEGREMLLQILNDIRVESWRRLGEPENLEMTIFGLAKEKVKYYHFMHLAGYFEHHFLNLEDDEN